MGYNNLWSQYLGNEHPYFPALRPPLGPRIAPPGDSSRWNGRVETAAAHGVEVG
jgi:hypothetical protein